MKLTKCTGVACSLKEKCYRYTMPVSENQEYFKTVPFKTPTECSHFWDNKGYKNQKNESTSNCNRDISAV